MLDRALALAEAAHADEKWRDGVTPYLSHPLAVASLVLRHGGTNAEAAAALVHDLIDRPSGRREALVDALGSEAAQIAHAFADPPAVSDSDWNAKKKAYLAQFRTAAASAQFVIVCEEFHELTDLLRELRRSAPPEVWRRYPVPAMNVAWYFKEIFAAAHAAWKSDAPAGRRALLAEYARVLVELNEIVFESGPAGRA